MDKIVTSVSRLSMFPKQCTAHVVTCVKDVNLFNIMSCNFSSFPPPRFVLASFVCVRFFQRVGILRVLKINPKYVKCQQLSQKTIIPDKRKNLGANVSFRKFAQRGWYEKFLEAGPYKISCIASSWMDNFGNSSSFSAHVRWCFPVAVPPHEVEAPPGWQPHVKSYLAIKSHFLPPCRRMISSSLHRFHL